MLGSRKQDTREVNGLQLTTIQLPSTRGSRLRFRLIKLVGPAVGALAAGLKGKKVETLEDLKALDVGVLAPAIMAVAQQLDEALHDALLLQLLCCSTVTGEGPNGKVKVDLTSISAFDQAFGGDVDALWAAAKASLEVNLGGFFDGRSGAGEPPDPTPSG